MKTVILTMITAPLAMHHGIHHINIQEPTLQMLFWIVLIIAMSAAFVTACAYFCRH